MASKEMFGRFGHPAPTEGIMQSVMSRLQSMPWGVVAQIPAFPGTSAEAVLLMKHPYDAAQRFPVPVNAKRAIKNMVETLSFHENRICNYLLRVRSHAVTAYHVARGVSDNVQGGSAFDKIMEALAIRYQDFT